MAANVFDALDGRIARVTAHDVALRHRVRFALRDLVAFGVAPGILVYCWALEPWGHVRAGWRRRST